MNRKFSDRQIGEIYEELRGLGKFQLPDHLVEAGLSIYKISVDKLRQKQERISGLLIDIQEESALVRKLLAVGKELWKREFRIAMQDPRVTILTTRTAMESKAEEIAKEKCKDLKELDDYSRSLEDLKEICKHVYTDLTKARSDLKIKVELLEMEVSMNPGTFKRGVIGSKMSAGRVNWDELKEEKGGEKDGPTESK